MVVEFVSDIIGRTVNDFIDWAMLVVLVLIIWYIIKLFMVPKPSEADRAKSEEEWAKRGAGVRDWVKGKYEEVADTEKKRKEKLEEDAKVARRRKLLGPAKGATINVVEAADQLMDGLNKHSAPGLTEARNSIRKMEKNLRLAKNAVRAAWRGADSTKRNWLHQLRAYIETIEQANGQITNYIPTNITDPRWNLKVGAIRTITNNIKTRSGFVIDAIDDFIDNDNTRTLPGTGPIPPPPLPSP